LGSEWDRFAEQEYEMMAMEEDAAQCQDDEGSAPMEILDSKEF
jgi:hypothetical protein